MVRSILLCVLVICGLAAIEPPEPPRVHLDTTYAVPVGATIVVQAGDDLQAAIDAAQPGDTLVLAAGATFTGPFILPDKGPTGAWIHLRSSGYAQLPPPGVRVGPSHAVHMPRITVGAGAGPAIRTQLRAGRYRFVGIEVAPAAGVFVTNLIEIGNGDTGTATLAHDITFDRCYIHGDPAVGGRRGLALNGIAMACVDAHVADFKEAGADSQAVWVNGPGPVKLANNHLEGAGENVLFGGADPVIQGLIPSDIELRGNLLTKPLAWMAENWVVKNILEFKNAQRVLVQDNILENNWPGGQNGYALLITPRNQDGAAPWCTTRDIVVRRNTLRNLACGVNISGIDGIWPGPTPILTFRVLIEENVLELSGLGGGRGFAFQVLDGVTDLAIRRNTIVNTVTGDGGIMLLDGGIPGVRVLFVDNIADRAAYGIIGSGRAEGVASLDHFLDGWTCTGNLLIGPGATSVYPAGNAFAADAVAAGIDDRAGGDHRLASDSVHRGTATDGGDPGADAAPPVAGRPVVTSPLTATARLGGGWTYAIEATDRPTHYAATGLPEGLSCAAATGRISGTPRVSGAHAVVLSAGNASGTGSATLLLDVRAEGAAGAGRRCGWGAGMLLVGLGSLACWRRRSDIVLSHPPGS